jgi:hypothetical protein
LSAAGNYAGRGQQQTTTNKKERDQMNTTFLISATLLLSATLLFIIPKKISEWRFIKRGGEWLANAITSVNIFQDGRATYLADNAFTVRYLLAKIGSDVNHIDICAVGDIPLGFVPDMNPSADGDLTYPLPVSILCLAGNETQRGVANAAITLGDFLVPAGAGKVKTCPFTTGTWYVVGRALTAAAANNDLVHIAPMFFKVVTP